MVESIDPGVRANRRNPSSALYPLCDRGNTACLPATVAFLYKIILTLSKRIVVSFQ